MPGEKVLVVEDDTLLQRMYTTVLTNAGYLVSVAEDGEAGLAAAKKELPSAIMMDVMMPKMSGLQVMDELKRDPKTAKIPIIVLTGLSKVNEQKDVLSRGAKMYLDKSDYDPHRVVKLLAQVIADSGMAAQASAPAPQPEAAAAVPSQPVAAAKPAPSVAQPETKTK